MRKFAIACLVGSVCLGSVKAQAQVFDAAGNEIPGVVYYGTDSLMTFKRFASYCAPAVWFSPDEPLVTIQPDGYFQLPLPLPFEAPTDSAVVYYRISQVIGQPGVPVNKFWKTAAQKDDWELNLRNVSQITMHFFFYYDRETGVGAHPHDFETTEFSIDVHEDAHGHFMAQVDEIIAHAHGVPWYFNVLDVEKAGNAVFPTTILVEEGKHGNCTDRNGDGFYSPGYDVNKRINDAWGVRDIMSVGLVVTSSYQTWMTKIRWRPYRIAPPLPEDSPWYKEFSTDYVFAEDNKRQYALRPVPNIEDVDFAAIEGGEHLKHFIETKGYPNWPEGVEENPFGVVQRELFDESFLGSWGYGYRYDGISSLTITFPLLLVRNFEVPLMGGWFVQRVYMNLGLLKGKEFQVWGQEITYTPSASRWVDWYIGAGYDVRNTETDGNKVRFIYESGTKFRANLSHTSLKFLRYLGSDFWGLRFGVQATGFPDIIDLNFLVEVGAGVW